MKLTALEQAREEDQSEIDTIFRQTVICLNQNGIPQWDEVYPTIDNIREDIAKGELYVSRYKDQIAAVITLNHQYDAAYANGAWEYQGTEFRVVHRMIVSPAVQGRGIGTQMMTMAEDMLRQQGVKSIRLDAFSKNPISLHLYHKLGYQIVGEAVWRMGLFYLMEKNIADDA